MMALKVQSSVSKQNASGRGRAKKKRRRPSSDIVRRSNDAELVEKVLKYLKEVVSMNKNRRTVCKEVDIENFEINQRVGPRHYGKPFSSLSLSTWKFFRTF